MENQHEDSVLGRLIECCPPATQLATTVMGDRGFGDQKLFKALEECELKYIIRFRECILSLR